MAHATDQTLSALLPGLVTADGTAIGSQQFKSLLAGYDADEARFEAGENKRVAVKILDDRGIESLKVIALD